MADEEKQALQSWWLALDEDQQAEAGRLVENDPVPGWMVKELRGAGVSQAADWWPQTDHGEQTTPAELVEFIADQDPDTA